MKATDEIIDGPLSTKKKFVERDYVIAARNEYLKGIQTNRQSFNPRPEVFIDETWVYQYSNVKHEKREDDSKGPKINSRRRDSRYIIIHAGSDEGFVPGALLTFKSNIKSKGDNRDSILDSERFKKWFEEQLLPNIQKESLIILDNAPYHCKIINKIPTHNNSKAQIINWLNLNGIHDYNPSLTKLKLIQICKKYKAYETYEIDKIAAENGHKVLRLPPYHCKFNPIEIIWAKIKKFTLKSDQSLENLEKITKEAIENITTQDWKNAITHVKKLEKTYGLFEKF